MLCSQGALSEASNFVQRKRFEGAREQQWGSVLGQFITAFGWALGMNGLRGRQGRERCDHLTTRGSGHVLLRVLLVYYIEDDF